jgi:predicted  nucleic acid-binding Zn-ribbon protein
MDESISNISKEPITFVVYNAAPSDKKYPEYRVVSLKLPNGVKESKPILTNYIGIGFSSNSQLLKEKYINKKSKDIYAVPNDDKSSFSYYAKRVKDKNKIKISDVSLETFENIGANEIKKLTEEIAKNKGDWQIARSNKLFIFFIKERLKKVRAYYREQPLFIATARQWLSEKPWLTSKEQADDDSFNSLFEEYRNTDTPKSIQQATKKSASPKTAIAKSGSVLHAVDDKTATERRELDREAVAFHERNIQSIRRNLERDREELAEETDLDRRHALEQRILHAQSDIQSERDRIATLKTGTLVHSRSPFDDYAKSRFIQNIARDQRKMETITRATEYAYKLAERLPEDKARQIRALADKHLGPELMASLDAQKASDVINTLSSVAQSHWEAERYKADADAAWADAGLQTALSVKNRADQAMEYASMAGGQSVYMAYQGATGYIEGGPKEAVLRVAGSYNKVTGTVASAYRGYEEDGVKEAFLRVAGSYNEATGWAEDFYRGYQAADGDLLEAMGGATWKMTKAMAINKGTQFAANRISQRYAAAPKNASSVTKIAAGKKTKTGKRPTQALGRAKQKPSDPNAAFNRPLTDREIKAFRGQVADGRTRVTSYKKTYARLQRARKAKAPPKEIKKLLRELDDRAAKIHGSPQAKIMMKNLQSSPKNKDLVKRYCNAMDRVHTRTEKRFRSNMAQKGWKTQNMVPIRNKASGKSVNMDYDIALKEEPWFDSNGKPNPWLTKNGKNAPVVAWQAEAQREWNTAFRAETGQDPSRSFETVTTSTHHEAYADLKVLEKNGVLDADKGWAQQTGDVSQAKAWDLRANKKMGWAEKYVEIARGTAKDAKRKLLPLLDKNKPKQGTSSYGVWEKHKNYWTKVSQVMEDMGSMKLNPMEADRKIRLITGGKSVVEVTEDMGQLMSASITLGK